jgi:hypothetical protein
VSRLTSFSAIREEGRERKVVTRGQPNNSEKYNKREKRFFTLIF